MRFLAVALGLSLVLTLAAPASAHIVYFKDGTTVRGAVSIKEGSLIVKGDDTELTFPLDSVRSVSFSDEPIVYEQRRLEDTHYFNSDWLLWTAVGVNVLAIAAAAVMIARPGTVSPLATRP